MEFLSGHYGIDGSGSGAFPGYAYYPTQGVNTTKLYGPYGFTVSSATATTAATINQNAINAIPADQAEFNTDTELAANGYVNTTARGSLQVTVANSAGWSSNTANNTIVLSQPGVNFQESTQGYQYWGQLSQNGSTTITGIVPGAYRMSIYELGQWGESRFDGVQISGTRPRFPPTPNLRPRTSAPRPRSGRSARPIARPTSSSTATTPPAPTSEPIMAPTTIGPRKPPWAIRARSSTTPRPSARRPPPTTRTTGSRPSGDFRPRRIRPQRRHRGQLRQCLSRLRYRGRRSGDLFGIALGGAFHDHRRAKGPGAIRRALGGTGRYRGKPDRYA